MVGLELIYFPLHFFSFTELTLSEFQPEHNYTVSFQCMLNFYLNFFLTENI